jgi:thioredoxin 1
MSKANPEAIPSNSAHKIQTSPLLLAYFSFPECQVCKILRPRVENLLKEYPGFEFLYVDVNQEPQLKGQYLAFTVPVIILFQEGKEIKRFGRYLSLQELSTFLQRISGAGT